MEMCKLDFIGYGLVNGVVSFIGGGLVNGFVSFFGGGLAGGVVTFISVLFLFRLGDPTADAMGVVGCCFSLLDNMKYVLPYMYVPGCEVLCGKMPRKFQ